MLKLGRRRVISCHLREIGGYLITVGYICYHGNNLVLIMNLRPGGMMVVQQQGMEVLGVNLSPSVSVKDRFAVTSSCHVERMPTT